MHMTEVKMKDGTVWRGRMQQWRPEIGRLTMYCHDAAAPTPVDVSRDLRFEDMASARTFDVRLTIHEVGDRDELARARRDLADGREHNWEGFPKEKQTWE